MRRSELVRDPADAAARGSRETEGVVAKRLDAPTPPASARRWSRSSALRTIDCVVDRLPARASSRTRVGSLILGLYEPDGTLRPVGHSSAFSASAQARAVGASSRPYETGARGSGEPSRWTAERELEWVELRPELVVEVSYDHVSDGRIRHGTKIVRWRDDKPPRECTIDQLR